MTQTLKAVRKRIPHSLREEDYIEEFNKRSIPYQVLGIDELDQSKLYKVIEIKAVEDEKFGLSTLAIVEFEDDKQNVYIMLPNRFNGIAPIKNPHNIYLSYNGENIEGEFNVTLTPLFKSVGHLE